MKYYQNKTFCREDTCAKFNCECHLSLTRDVAREAFGQPLISFIVRPACYVSRCVNDDKEKSAA